jgi:hypothetical protein
MWDAFDAAFRPAPFSIFHFHISHQLRTATVPHQPQNWSLGQSNFSSRCAMLRMEKSLMTRALSSVRRPSHSAPGPARRSPKGLRWRVTDHYSQTTNHCISLAVVAATRKCPRIEFPATNSKQTSGTNSNRRYFRARPVAPDSKFGVRGPARRGLCAGGLGLAFIGRGSPRPTSRAVSARLSPAINKLRSIYSPLALFHLSNSRLTKLTSALSFLVRGSLIPGARCVRASGTRITNHQSLIF